MAIHKGAYASRDAYLSQKKKNAPIVAGQEPYLHARGSDKSNNTAASVDQ